MKGVEDPDRAGKEGKVDSDRQKEAREDGNGFQRGMSQMIHIRHAFVD